MTGTIERIHEKGFGFISVPGQKQDVFFHASALQDVVFDATLKGMRVEFETEQAERGPRATFVKPAA